MSDWRWWKIFRAALFLAGLSLVGYIAYRYTMFQPVDHGSLYGKIFPLSLLLAVAAMAVALRPRLFRSVKGRAGQALRGGFTAFGAVWMATGLMCLAAFKETMTTAPLDGVIFYGHMFSDHVFLTLGVVALAWAPARLAKWMGAEEPEPAIAAEPALGAAGD